jgi:hypothetical protein
MDSMARQRSRQERHFPEGGPPRRGWDISSTSNDSCEQLTAEDGNQRNERRGPDMGSPVANQVSPSKRVGRGSSW